ncbi:variable large family protein [Borrelia puertoricensis]|uniref:variable large family protein n=1 Tax=Borrelia puertoricensis TaxID=2756107 RepID=UPI003EBF84F2
MKRITLCALLMILFLLLGCGSGQLQAEKLAAESKNTFLDSLVKIGHGFYEIFGVFGNAFGDALGLTAVKSGDKRSKVGEHFDKIKKGLGDTKDKLNELSDKISETKNANSGTIDAAKSAINTTNDVFEQLITALTKLADVTKDDSPIGDTASAATTVAANKDNVEAIIAGVQEIIKTAEKSNVKIEKGTAGGAVNATATTDATAALNANGAATAGAAAKLAAEVAKADPWAMIDKIKNAKADNAQLNANAANKDAGELSVGIPGHANGAGAATNADLAAAVALKAMTKAGKFSAAANETDSTTAAAISAVNKVLGVLDLIIRKTVSNNLNKIRETVKGIQYFETTTESTEASSTTQPNATK